MNMIDMYEKVGLIIVVIFVVGRSEGISSNVKIDTQFLDSSLSTAFPYLSLHNDQQSQDDQEKLSLLLMPQHQYIHQYKQENETIHKTKRCSQLSQRKKLLLIKNKFAKTKSSNENNGVEVSKNNFNVYAKPCNEGKILLRIPKSNVNGQHVIVSLQPRETIKKCNAGKCVCYCKNKDCSHTLRKNQSERMNYRVAGQENKRLNMRRKPSRLQHENVYQSRTPNLINPFPIRSFPKGSTGIPATLIRYRIIPYLPSDTIGNVERVVDVGTPPSTVESESRFLVGSNIHPRYGAFIHPNTYLNSPTTERSREALDASSLMNSIDTTESVILESYNPTGIIGEEEASELSREISDNYASELSDAKHYNSYSNYSSNMIEENNIVDFSRSDDETLYKSEGPIENLEADHVSASTPAVIYSPMTHDGKLIDMEECMKLFDRDVCVLSATSSQTSADETRVANLNGYSTIAVPEYVMQMSSTKNGMTTDHDFNNFNKQFATSAKSNVDSNVQSTNAELNIVDEDTLSTFSPYTDPTVQAYTDNSDESSSIDVPLSKMIFQPHSATDKSIEIARNNMLGKSKSDEAKLSLSLNGEEMKTPSLNEELFYSTTSYNYDDKKLNNLEINHQENWATSTDRWENIPQEEETAVAGYRDSDGSKVDFKDESTNHLKEEFITSVDPEEDKKEETINHNFDTYSDEEDLQFTTMRYIDYEESTESNNKDDSLDTDLSTRRLPFCDNTLLLNSIRKVINDFTLDDRAGEPKTITKDIQLHGKNLLPEILRVRHLDDILSIPRVEETIVEKVKNVLSDVTAIPRRDFMNDWSHGVIRNTLRNILKALSGFRQKQTPPMTVEEHQYKNGHWTTNLVTLAPLVDDRLSKANPANLRESIKDLLTSSAIVSQADQYIVRNIIVQSVKNSLINDERNEETDDSIISNVLNDVLQLSKHPEDINALTTSNTLVNNAENMETAVLRGTTDRYKLENSEKLGVEEEVRIDDDRMQIATTEKVIVPIASKSPNLSESHDKDEHLYIKEEEIPKKDINAMEENIREQILDGIRKNDDVQTEKDKLPETLKPVKIYEKAILQNNRNILKRPNSKDESNSDGNSDFPSNDRVFEKTDNHRIADETATPVSHYTHDILSDIQTSDDKTVPDTTQMKNVVDDDVEYPLNEKKLATALPDNLISSANVKYGNSELETTSVTSAADEIDPAIILARLEYNLPAIKYYSPENLKYAQKHRVEDKNAVTTSANFMQGISPNQIPISIIERNMADAKNTGDKIEEDTLNGRVSTTSTDNIISSKNHLSQYANHESEISPVTNKSVLQLQRHNFTTEDGIVKIEEITTEIQRTYAKTTYFSPKSSADNDSRISLFPSTPQDATCNNCKGKSNGNDNGSDNNYDFIDNNINNINRISTEANEATISSSNYLSSSLDDNYSLPLFSSTASDDISKLEQSQLYYISDGVKLPLEIIKLKNGSYALSISKNVCEIILGKNCSSCRVPLQGRVVTSSRKTHQETNADQLSSYTTAESILKMQKQDQQEEGINARYLWKRNLNKNLTIPMPVIDFARKYNLSLDFDQEDVPFNGMESQRKNIETIQSRRFDKSKVNKFDSNMQTNTGTVKDAYSDVGKRKLRKCEKMDNSILRHNILKKKGKREDKEPGLIDEENVSRIRIFKKNTARSCRDEQISTHSTNRGIRLVKSILYWFKSLFEKNEQ